MARLALYAVLLVSANAAAGQDATGQDPAELMQKLVLADPVKPLATAELLDMNDAPVSTGSFAGRWVVLNFWATWCAPCRAEMPSLDALAAARPDILVVPVATGPNPLPAITRFWDEAAITHLTPLRDPSRALSASAGVLALPVTLILNPDGQEVARLIGDADWSSPQAIAALDAMMQPANP